MVISASFLVHMVFVLLTSPQGLHYYAGPIVEGVGGSGRYSYWNLVLTIGFIAASTLIGNLLHGWKKKHGQKKR